MQATAWFAPYDMGGTEVYVEGLARALKSGGITPTVIAPRHANAPASYEHRDVKVLTYRVNERPTREELRSGHPHDNFHEFLSLIDGARGAIYHQHSWTRGCGPNHIRAAKERGMRTVLTVHVAGNICLRGTMLRFGAAPCNGHVDDRMCGACWCESKGIPLSAARAIAALPKAITAVERHLPSGRLGTAMRARQLAAGKLASIAEAFRSADRVVVVCEWLRSAMIAMGAPTSQLFLSRQGLEDRYVADAHEAALASREASRPGPLRLLFLGRWDPSKGLDTAVRAVRAVANEHAVKLTIRCANSVTDDGSFEAHVRSLAEGDERIEFQRAISREGLASEMSRHDALVVPSLWLETGPLVVLEAQAAGLFILGSDRGGIAELVRNGEDGLLLPPRDVSAWTSAIENLAREQAAGRLLRQPRQVRTMATVATEMTALYRELAA